jgi:hypothetical protein
LKRKGFRPYIIIAGKASAMWSYETASDIVKKLFGTERTINTFMGIKKLQ